MIPVLPLMFLFHSLAVCCPLYIFLFLVLASNPTEEVCQFALWVAFFEIYNECVYDLLQSSLCSKSKRRAALRVCDDGAGNAYVKGVSMSLSRVLKLEETYQK